MLTDFLKAQTFDSAKHAWPRYRQVKLDGQRLKFVRYAHEPGVVRAYTTRWIDIFKEISHYGWCQRIARHIQANEALDGELHPEITGGNYGKREIVKTLRAEGKGLGFTPFATNQMMSFATLPQVEQYIFAKYQLITAPYEELVAGQTVEDLFKSARLHGWEGFVLKDGNLKNWYKLKEEKTIDLIVTGVNKGTVGTKWEGKFSSVTVSSIEGFELANVSGMSDEIRLSLDLGCIGRIVEVEYQRLGSAGRLQHPRFLRWRDDEKLAGECTITQDSEIEAYYA